MKKLLVLFSATLICVSAMTRDRGNTWILTDQGRIDCKKLALGYNKARIVSENGQKENVTFSAINSFSLNGKVFNKLPLYKDGKPTNQGAFMELIRTQGNLSLYKLGYFDLGSPDPNKITYHYFLYDGTKMHVALNERGLANICYHFKVQEDEL